MVVRDETGYSTFILDADVLAKVSERAKQRATEELGKNGVDDDSNDLWFSSDDDSSGDRAIIEEAYYDSQTGEIRVSTSFHVKEGGALLHHTVDIKPDLDMVIDILKAHVERMNRMKAALEGAKTF